MLGSSSYNFYEKLWKTLRGNLEPSVKSGRTMCSRLLSGLGMLEFVTNRLEFVAYRMIDFEFYSL